MNTNKISKTLYILVKDDNVSLHFLIFHSEVSNTCLTYV